MPLKKFLNSILPNEGYKCWVEISKNKKVTQGLVPTIEELADKLLEIDSRGDDAYFGCAAFATPQNRRSGNALSAKAFWADVDCGEGKPYATVQDAIQACDEFCARAALPLPGMVRSGGGIHIYWPLDRTISAQEWRGAAQQLKLLMQAQGFHADPSRTADIASILRAPGTKNYKLSQPRDVVVDDFDLFDEVNTDGFLSTLAISQSPRTLGVGAVHNMGGSNSHLVAGITSSKFAEVSKGVAEGGRNAACATYAGGLLVKGHSTDEVLKLCLEWNQLNQPPLPEQEIHTTVASIARRHKENHPAPLPEAEQAALPKLPSGFDWAGGQLITYVEDENGIKKPKVITHLPVFLTSLLNEEGYKVKNSYMFTHYHPEKGWQQFAMSARDFNSGEWYGYWVEKGCSVVDGMDKLFKIFVRRSENMLRESGKESTRYSQFGWKGNNEAFLVGQTLCHANGSVERVIGSDKLAPLMKTMTPVKNGSLANWTSAADKLATPGLEGHLFMVLASMAAPLMPFCVDEGNGGSILSIISEESGYGKTPMSTAAASVWGDPGSCVISGNFTENRAIEDLVRRQHLPIIKEEGGYGDPTVAAQGVEKFTSGTDRGRLNRSGAATDIPERYQTIMISLSNKSLYNMVKLVNGPMSRRVFEIELDRPDEDSLANLGGIARQMMQNSGHAGLALARIIVNPEVVKYLKEHLRGQNEGQVGSTQMKYRLALQSRPEHRFIVWLMSAVDVVARIATHYGLLHFDVERVMGWAVERARIRTDGVVENESASRLNSFLLEHVENCLTVSGPYQPKSGPLLPIKRPTRALHMRLEMKNERLYIAQEALNRWCIKNALSFISMGKRLVEQGVLLERNKSVALGMGTEIASGRSLCWEIDMGHPLINGQLRITAENNAAGKAGAV